MANSEIAFVEWDIQHKMRTYEMVDDKLLVLIDTKVLTGISVNLQLMRDNRYVVLD